MPYTKVLIHFIWATKNREHLISKELKILLLQHIKENSIKKLIFINTINCVSDQTRHKKKAFAEEYGEFLHAHHFERVLAKANI